jgi:glycerol-3-phosphate acyltransferase PlsY
MRGIDGGDAIVGICGVLVVIGHIFPIFFKFKGGKGVATAIGVLLGFNPILALLVVVSWFVVFKFTRVSSLSAILATFLSPLYAYVLFQNTSYFGATLMIAVIVIFKHQSNIVRLIKGEEASFKRKEKTDHAKGNTDSDSDEV